MVILLYGSFFFSRYVLNLTFTSNKSNRLNNNRFSAGDDHPEKGGQASADSDFCRGGRLRGLGFLSGRVKDVDGPCGLYYSSFVRKGLLIFYFLFEDADADLTGRR
jgi:hypothetical protein